MVSSSNILQQFGNIGIAISDNVYLIILKGQCHVLVDKEVDQLAMTLWHTEVFLFNKTQHGALSELIERALTDQTLSAMIDAKKEVKDDADKRDKEYHQRPRHRLSGLPVVHNDMDNGGCYQYPCKGDTYYI